MGRKPTKSEPTEKKVTQSRRKKCKICGNLLNEDEIIVIDKLNYCVECAEIREKEKKYNKKLNEYIYSLCGGDRAVMPLMCKQIKNMKDEYGYISSGILATLKYMYEIMSPPIEFNPEYGVANVPYYYYQARNFNVKYFYLKEKAKEDVCEPEPKTIVLKRSSMMEQDKNFWENKKEKEMGPDIDLNSIILDEEG